MTDDEKQRIREWVAGHTALSAEELAAMDAEELNTTRMALLRARLEFQCKQYDHGEKLAR